MRSFFFTTVLATAALATAGLSLGCAPEGESTNPVEVPSKLDPWGKTLGTAAFPQTLASGPDGSVLVGGQLVGAVDLGGGLLTSVDPSSLFLAYYDADGEHRMSGVTGSADSITAMAIGPDGAMCAVGNVNGKIGFGDSTLEGSGDGWLACFEKDGSLRFSKLIVSDYSVDLESVAFTPSGNIVLGLEADDSVDFGAGPKSHSAEGNAIVAELTPLGYPLWDYRIPWNPSRPVQVAAGPDGAVWFSAQFWTPVEVDGETLGRGLTIGKLDATGHLLFRATEEKDDGGLTYLRSFAADEDGDLYIAGTDYSNTLNIAGLSLEDGASSSFVAKISPEGEGLWIKPLGSEDDSAPIVLAAPVPGGGVLVAANIFGPLDFGAGPVGEVASKTEVAVARLSPNGAVEQAVALESYSDVYLQSLAADPKGQPVLTGQFRIDVQLGPDGSPKLTGSGGQESFVGRVAF